MTEYINTATGEIVDTSTPRQRGRVASVRQYIGMDTKYPSECVTADSLLEALRNIDACLHYKPNIDYAFLTDSLTDKHLSVQEVSLLTKLGKELVAWNYWMGNRATLAEQVDGRVRRTLQSLIQNGMVRLLHENKPFKNDLVLLVNPMVAFRGSYLFRESAIRRWHSGVQNLAT